MMSKSSSLPLSHEHIRQKCGKAIAYVTDIEGNYDYWQRYLKMSNALYKVDASNGSYSVKLRDECEFVYGGDICDRGPGKRVITLFIHLCDTAVCVSTTVLYVYVFDV